MNDKQLKIKYKKVFSNTPEKYYPVNFIKKQGFYRNQCEKCKKYFWSTDKNRTVCGDAECLGGINLFNKKPIKNKLSYIDVWKTYSEFFEKRGYTPIQRYPVVARWNPTVDFTIASIAAFQPYVISGEADAPHTKLVIPQFCLRFGDIDNVGITGSHCTGFVMIGQHVFVPKQDWNQNTYFQDIFEYLINIVGLDKNLLILHEDAWAGGSNYGPCIEFFSCGIELFNQVYMMFEHQEKQDKELSMRVLDMGLGMERIAWFTQVTPTLYDAIMPKTLNKIIKKTGVKFDYELYKKFAPYSSLLNLDEVDNIDQQWKTIATKLDMSVNELKEKIKPMTATYSIAEHTRSLLFAITDGALPSNTGGGYNLRVILRRALNFLNKNSWNLNLSQIAEWHAHELKTLYPELENSLNEVKEILDYETEKYYETLERNKNIIQKIKKTNQNIDLNKLIDLYDSNGILPEELKDFIDIKIPENFYALVAEKHSQKQNIETQTKKQTNLDLKNIPKTEILYFDDYTLTEFDAIILKIIDNYVILDATAFYPTSGGQLHDTGTIKNAKVTDIFKQGNIIIHKVDNASQLKEKELVHSEIDLDRRLQLAQHHTATHIVNGAAKQILGKHIWQAGASKTLKKARLDITHHKQITQTQLKKIEKLANEKIKENVTIEKTLMKRKLAEAKYGFRLYQGGAVPGKILRIVNIPGFDVEACGGTHLNTTSETSLIKIIKSSKIQDGIVRIEFTAGNAALKLQEENTKIKQKLQELLECEESQIPARAQELFKKWKKVKKLRKKKKEIPEHYLKLSSTEQFSGDVLEETAKILRTQKQHLIKTTEKFLAILKQ